MDAFHLFLHNYVLSKLVRNLTRVLTSRSKDTTTITDLKGVLVKHVSAASYSNSVSTITAPQNREFFYQLGIPANRYSDI